MVVDELESFRTKFIKYFFIFSALISSLDPELYTQPCVAYILQYNDIIKPAK